MALSRSVLVYALTSSQCLYETLDLFLTREAAEAELCEILEDEPDWKDVLRVVPIELDGRCRRTKRAREVVLPKGRQPSGAVSLDEQLGPLRIRRGIKRLACGARTCPGPAWAARTLEGVPEEKQPDLRPQLREFLAWYEKVLGRIESGAVVAPGEQERLTAEASAVAHLLDLLDSSADEPAS
jgi:hypothetical protein